QVNIEITDLDRDLTDAAETLQALVEVWRPKTDEELEADAAKLVTEGKAVDSAAALEGDGEGLKIERFKKIDSVTVTLTEAKLETPVPDFGSDPAGERGASAPRSDQSAKAPSPPAPETTPAEESAAAALAKATGAIANEPAAPPATADATAQPSPIQPADDGSIHSGVFRAVVPLANIETADPNDQVLQALAGDEVRVTYLDERNSSDGANTIVAKARAVDGNLGGVRVTRAVISDQELRIRTQLKTAAALTAIGNRYKEFGLKRNADAKYQQALEVCEGIMDDARRLGGRLLEETYVQLWQVYFEMDRLSLAAAMAERLQREFPNSGFVDDALLQLADVARKAGDLQRAIGIYNRLVGMQTSQLRGEAQFGIAACYEQMADDNPGPQAPQLRDRAFQEYKKVFDNFPDSGRVGEAVAKMADYYYQQKDYARAVDTFETVLSDYPDAKFLDVILFNYGRCLYRMERRGEARSRFDQLIGEFPESPLAADAKKISDALAKAGF
ncbi:MAG: tetratricopeptide repeat protein, partial [Planctomycetes bacterium]|nr:tetratricopeptide repeat protein [Planctomycetota bacterium]